MRYAASRRPKNLRSLVFLPTSTPPHDRRFLPVSVAADTAAAPRPQSRPIVIAVRGRFRKEGRFLKLVACGHDATEERGREEVPHTNRTHAHAPTPPAKPRPARASERRRERARPQYPTTPPLHLAARSGNPPPPLLLRPDALQSWPDGVRRETSTCGRRAC